ncbi:MAG: ABC transporter ATP-binding protein [Candidatus Diapherotrites archaeon]
MLNVRNVSKSFQQNKESLDAIEDVSLDVKEGEFVAVVGPSGCGKTTLLKIIAGLVKPSSGSTVSSGDEKKPKVGFVFQKPNLLEWRTVEENVVLPLEISGKKKNVKKLLKLVDLQSFRGYIPEQLSGGMQQRAAIARALAGNPEILLMDEPFSAIDDFGREELNLALAKIWAKTGKTIVFVTHNIEEAIFLADRVVVLSERPARVKEVIHVALARPRLAGIKHSQVFQGYVKWVKSVLKS